MSKTPRTDAAKFKIISMLQSGTVEVVYIDLAHQLETELAAKTAELEEANKKLDGWAVQVSEAIRQAEASDQLFRKQCAKIENLRAELRQARAKAFEEAAEVAWCVKDQDMLTAKASAIRKGEEK